MTDIIDFCRHADADTLDRMREKKLAELEYTDDESLIPTMMARGMTKYSDLELLALIQLEDFPRPIVKEGRFVWRKDDIAAWRLARETSLLSQLGSHF